MKPPTEFQRAIMIKIMHNLIVMQIMVFSGTRRRIAYFSGSREVTSTVGELKKKGLVNLAMGLGLPTLTDKGLQALKELQDGPATNGE